MVVPYVCACVWIFSMICSVFGFYLNFNIFHRFIGFWTLQAVFLVLICKAWGVCLSISPICDAISFLYYLHKKSNNIVLFFEVHKIWYYYCCSLCWFYSKNFQRELIISRLKSHSPLKNIPSEQLLII